jgi:hypothetical protein
MENSVFVPQIHQVQTCKSMQKLKFEPFNGFGVLVDESTIGTNAGQGIYFDSWENAYPKIDKIYESDEVQPTSLKIIFAEKELNLEGVPIFEWREFALSLEIIPKATEFVKTKVKMSSQAPGVLIGFVEGYKSNPAKYTEEDLRKAIQKAWSSIDHDDEVGWFYYKNEDQIIQSFQKYPKYVVMETEIVDFAAPDRIDYDYKLFTNSEGKQQGTVKELIWES